MIARLLTSVQSLLIKPLSFQAVQADRKSQCLVCPPLFTTLCHRSVFLFPSRPTQKFNETHSSRGFHGFPLEAVHSWQRYHKNLAMAQFSPSFELRSNDWRSLFGYMEDGRKEADLSDEEKIELGLETPTARRWVPLLLSPTARNRSELPEGPDDDIPRSAEDEATRIVAKELGSKATVIPAKQFKVYSGFGVRTSIARNQLKGHLALQEGLAEVQMQAFMFSQEITSITLPNSLELVDEQAFYGCSKLVAVHIPDSVKTIRSRAFYNTSLKIVSIPESTTLSELTGPVFPDNCKVVVRNTKI